MNIRTAFLEQRAKPYRGTVPTKRCIFNHKMTKVDRGVWFCPDPFCLVLSVTVNFPGSYRYHDGCGYISFSYEEAENYIMGKEPLVDLVVTKLEEEDK